MRLYSTNYLAVLLMCLCNLIQISLPNEWNMFDLSYWRCVLKKHNKCPNQDVAFYLYTHEGGPHRKRIDLRNPNSIKYSDWHPERKNVIIIHGFNGTERKSPMTILRDAYLSRIDYNVFTVDWEPLTKFPCYLSALSNTRLVAQCTAQLYSHLTHAGTLAKKITCIGHSLGAHICGMMSNYLDLPQHKIVGLDPARPLINEYGTNFFRLTKDDAHVVQIIHTNAGFLGDVDQIGHTDFCVNGGRNQPGCKGHAIRRARCSHFQSACYFAAGVRNERLLYGRPCSAKCPKPLNTDFLPGKPIPMGESTPENAHGTFCVQIDHDKDCPFD